MRKEVTYSMCLTPFITHYQLEHCKILRTVEWMISTRTSVPSIHGYPFISLSTALLQHTPLLMYSRRVGTPDPGSCWDPTG